MEPNSRLIERLVEQYKLSCEICGSYPELKFCQQFSKGKLTIDLLNISKSVLEILCHAMTQRITPITIEILSPPSQKFADEENFLPKIFESLSVAIKKSKTLSILKFCRLFIPANSISLLCKGLSKARNLQNLEFLDCPMKSSSIEEICHSIKNTSCIKSLCFDNCQINKEAVKHIKCLLMHQSFNRSSNLWKDTLRFQRPILDKINGLRYFVLNNNPHLGDDGLREFALVLTDDIWVTGIELQNCGITSKSVDIINELLEVNQTLERLSLINNPFLDSEYIDKVEEILDKRRPSTENIKEGKKLDGVNEIQPLGENTERQCKEKILPKRLKNLKPGVPWRIEGRLIERKEGLPVGTLSFILEEISKKKFKRKTKTKIEDHNQVINLHQIKKVIHHYKSKSKLESKRRLKAEKRLKKLETKLEDYEAIFEKNYIMSEATIHHIEECFSKFQVFLQKVQEARWYSNQLEPNDNAGEDFMTKRTSFLNNHMVPDFNSFKSTINNCFSSSSKRNRKKSACIYSKSVATQTDKRLKKISSKGNEVTDVSESYKPSSVSQSSSSHRKDENVKGESSFSHDESFKGRSDRSEKYFENCSSGKTHSSSNTITDISIEKSLKNGERNEMQIGNNSEDSFYSASSSEANGVTDKTPLVLHKNLKSNQNESEDITSANGSSNKSSSPNACNRNSSIKTVPKWTQEERYFKKNEIVLAPLEEVKVETEEENYFEKDPSNNGKIEESKEISDGNNVSGKSIKGLESNSYNESRSTSEDNWNPADLKNIQFISVPSTSTNMKLSFLDNNSAINDDHIASQILPKNVQSSSRPRANNSDVLENSIEYKNTKPVDDKSQYSTNEGSVEHFERNTQVVRNSQSPSIDSMSEQLSLGHETWIRRRKQINKRSLTDNSKSYSEDFATDAEDNEFEEISISQSFTESDTK